jgi:hypothetical protein
MVMRYRMKQPTQEVIFSNIPHGELSGIRNRTAHFQRPVSNTRRCYGQPANRIETGMPEQHN